MDHSDPSLPQKVSVPDGGPAAAPEFAEVDFSDEEALVFNVIMVGDVNSASFDLLMRLFTHPEKAQRVKIAAAYGAVNGRFTHDEESGFADKRTQFLIDTEEHHLDIQNAFFEALIASAEERTLTLLPYTMAWFPSQNRETVELLAWSAKHHQNWWARRFSVFFVVEFGGGRRPCRKGNSAQHSRPGLQSA